MGSSLGGVLTAAFVRFDTRSINMGKEGEEEAEGPILRETRERGRVARWALPHPLWL